MRWCVSDLQSALPSQHHFDGVSSASSPVSLDTAQLRCESIWVCQSCRQGRVSGIWFQGLLVVCGSDQQHETSGAAQHIALVDCSMSKAHTDPTGSCYSGECDRGASRGGFCCRAVSARLSRMEPLSLYTRLLRYTLQLIARCHIPDQRADRAGAVRANAHFR